WVQDKKQPWVLAGLLLAFTKKSQKIRINAPFTTNAKEFAYALLATIQS
ncbi:44948_t:CDS:1, partial [Gigaspora margarita]